MTLIELKWLLESKYLSVFGKEYLKLRGSLNKFPDLFRMGTFTHMKLKSHSK